VERGGGRRSTRYRVVPPAARQNELLQTKPGGRRRASGGPTPPVSDGQAPLAAGAHQWRAATPAMAARHPSGDTVTTAAVAPWSPESSSTPQGNGHVNLPRAAARDGIPTKIPTEREIERELHMFGREAEKVWSETANK